MRRLEQRGAVAFTGAAVAAVVHPPDHAMGVSVLGTRLPRCSISLSVFSRTSSSSLHTGSDEGRVGHPRPDPQVPRAELNSRKSPERFKLGFKTVTRPLVRHSIHVLAPDSRTDIGRAAIPPSP